MHSLWISITILVFALVGLGSAQAVQQYCSEDTRLETDYVTTTYEETRPVQGCVSTEKSSQNEFHVIVIRTNTSTSTNVLLTVTGKNYWNISNS